LPQLGDKRMHDDDNDDDDDDDGDDDDDDMHQNKRVKLQG